MCSSTNGILSFHWCKTVTDVSRCKYFILQKQRKLQKWSYTYSTAVTSKNERHMYKFSEIHRHGGERPAGRVYYGPTWRNTVLKCLLGSNCKRVTVRGRCQRNLMNRSLSQHVAETRYESLCTPIPSSLFIITPRYTCKLIPL